MRRGQVENNQVIARVGEIIKRYARLHGNKYKSLAFPFIVLNRNLPVCKIIIFQIII